LEKIYYSIILTKYYPEQNVEDVREEDMTQIGVKHVRKPEKQ
jgi:hypothetical protein